MLIIRQVAVKLNLQPSVASRSRSYCSLTESTVGLGILLSMEWFRGKAHWTLTHSSWDVIFITVVHAPLLRTDPTRCRSAGHIILSWHSFPKKSSVQWKESTSYLCRNQQRQRVLHNHHTKRAILAPYVINTQVDGISDLSQSKRGKCLRKWHGLSLVEMSHLSNLVLLRANTLVSPAGGCARAKSASSM